MQGTRVPLHCSPFLPLPPPPLLPPPLPLSPFQSTLASSCSFQSLPLALSPPRSGALESCAAAFWSPSLVRKQRRRRLSKLDAVANAVEERERERDTGTIGPRRIALFVEPSPFAYVSGYKNRFQNFIRYLREMGDEVLIITTHEGVPTEFHGAKVIGSWSFPCPFYKLVPLSLALSPRIISEVAHFKPDIIHASSPGIMVFGALAIAKLLHIPIVLSYHTHVPLYIPKYTFSWLVKPMWLIIKFLHRAADLTLVTSSVLGKELKAAGAATANKIRVWRKGVDSDRFHPRYKSDAMRNRLTGGEPERRLAIYVGRLGVEKNLEFLYKVMQRLPDARIAFVGDGPSRKDLEELFADLPVVFTGMLQGEELSQAYASADVFVMPSESETLGFVVLEAMASGVPVVAARAGGIPDIICEGGETGFLYAPGDLDECVNRVRSLFDCEELRQRIGDAGRKEVEKFDWRASTRQVRNEEYGAAIWFWRKRRQQFLRRLAWVMRKLHLKQRWPGGNVGSAT
ncbi:sulfoquinovosyl transferase SQD2-like [Selaginella moellendorffii]|uniref:sulfoquinovosyl transferase SQD2-like n=1 Tax=Selaginella moellendorffii TaxID=88036 RepID=UPI000D1CC7C5|nr:sulfoquinovosyl transferase SQD2-like [Selaginella moellendorffii]|eukprot:XP_024519455.1 sulfoquinovosyl transferase SQD2-like [Selaginella moellendorffii]